MNHVEEYSTDPKRTEDGAKKLLVKLLAEAKQAAQLVSNLAREDANSVPTRDACEAIDANLTLVQIQARNL